MATQTPLLFVDNQFDVNGLYPTATLFATSSLTGREPYRAIDARRERSWWQAATVATFHALSVDMGAGKTATPDYGFLDRGHNLWGHSVQLAAGTDGVTFPTIIWTRNVPALNADGSFPVGGDPTTGWCVTEEGALYTLFAATAAKRNFQFLFADNMQPVITGAMLGARTQLLTGQYPRTRDEDAGNRTEIQETSRSGYLGTDKRYGWRTFALDLTYIGAAQYDATIRTVVREWMFIRDQPWIGIMEYGTYPERAYMYRWDGTQFSAPMQRVYRGLQIRGREVGPLLR